MEIKMAFTGNQKIKVKSETIENNNNIKEKDLNENLSFLNTQKKHSDQKYSNQHIFKKMSYLSTFNNIAIHFIENDSFLEKSNEKNKEFNKVINFINEITNDICEKYNIEKNNYNDYLITHIKKFLSFLFSDFYRNNKHFNIDKDVVIENFDSTFALNDIEDFDLKDFFPQTDGLILNLEIDKSIKSVANSIAFLTKSIEENKNISSLGLNLNVNEFVSLYHSNIEKEIIDISIRIAKEYFLKYTNGDESRIVRIKFFSSILYFVTTSINNEYKKAIYKTIDYLSNQSKINADKFINKYKENGIPLENIEKNSKLYIDKLFSIYNDYKSI